MTPAKIFLALIEQMRVLAPNMASTSSTAGSSVLPSTSAVTTGTVDPETRLVSATTRGAAAVASSLGFSSTMYEAVAIAPATTAESDTEKLLKKITGPYAHVLRFV